MCVNPKDELLEGSKFLNITRYHESAESWFEPCCRIVCCAWPGGVREIVIHGQAEDLIR
jgi:hypothetical protein